MSITHPRQCGWPERYCSDCCRDAQIAALTAERDDLRERLKLARGHLRSLVLTHDMVVTGEITDADIKTFFEEARAFVWCEDQLIVREDGEG